MTLSYLALALAIVLFLAGMAGTISTLRTIAQRHPEHPDDIKAQTWNGISAPAHALQFHYIKFTIEHYARFSRLLNRVAYYLAPCIAAIEKAAVSLIRHLARRAD